MKTGTLALVLYGTLHSLLASVLSNVIVWENHIENGPFVVQAGDTLVLRGSNSVAGTLEVASGGQLTVDPAADSFLRAGAIDIYGAFRIGSLEHPHAQQAVFEIACGSPFLGPDVRRKAVVVRENGTLALFGAKGASSNTWTRLRDTANVGDTCLALDLPDGWRVGDQIVIPSTDFDPHQAEKRTIVSITPSCVELDAPLDFMHYGRVTEGVDERAEVGLLTRSIAFRGCQETVDLPAGVGAHMIFLENFRQVQVQGVELQNFGQGDQLGRYPMHFHLCGQVPSDTFLRANAIHDSNFRAVAIHGTQGVHLDGNVAYNITGHAVMMEDGAESGNVIRNNLIVLVKEKLTHVRLGSDSRVALSAFYITNPDNTITDNVVAGVEGSAYWIHTRLDVKGQSFMTGKYDGVHPFKIALGDMRRNAAHSVEIGFIIDSPDLDALDFPQQKYSPPYTYMPDRMPVLSDFVVHHARQGGWFRSFRVVMDNWVVGDVTEGVQVLSRGDTSSEAIETYVTNSLFVGGTANRGNLVQSHWQFINYLENRSDSAVDRTDDARMAIKLYDGPMSISNCTFKRWYSQPCLHVVNPAIGTRRFNTFLMSTAIVASDLVFEETDVKFHVSDREADGGKTTSMVDKLGVISGQPGAILLPDWGYYHTPTCMRSGDFGVACPHRYANLDIVSVDANSDPSRFGKIHVYRNNVGDQDSTPSLNFTGQFIPASVGWLYHPIVSPEASYTLRFDYHTPDRLRLVFSNTKSGDIYDLAVVYPATTQIVDVVDQAGSTLTLMSGFDDTSCLNCFWFDTERAILKIRVQERADPAGPAFSCSPRGCMSVEVKATVPADSGVSATAVDAVLPILRKTDAMSSWRRKAFAQEVAVYDSAKNMDWCNVDDPCLHAMDEGNVKMGVLAYFEQPCVGVGCFSNSCRYCKLTFSAAKVPFPGCPFDPNYTSGSVAATTCSEFASAGNSEAGVEPLHVNGIRYDLATFERPNDQCPNKDCPTNVRTTIAINTSAHFNVRSTTPIDYSAHYNVRSTIAIDISAYHANGASDVRRSPRSAPYMPCDQVTTTTDVSLAASTGSVARFDPCAGLVSSGDVAVGITSLTQLSCATAGGVGCVTDSCRYCKTRTTKQSAHLPNCTELVSTTPTTDRLLLAESGPLAPLAAVASIDVCSHEVSIQENVAGIFGFTDRSCARGNPVGCFSESCRYCRTDDALDVYTDDPRDTGVDGFTSCPLHVVSSSMGPSSLPFPSAALDCAASVSFGASLSGISAFKETRCSNNTNTANCFARLPCRYCQYRATARSSGLVLCPHASGDASPPPCSQLAALLHLANTSAVHEPRCVGAEANLSGCVAFTSCRLCATNALATTPTLPPCAGLDSLSIQLLSSGDGQPSLSHSPSWSPIIVSVVGLACAVAAATIVAHKIQRRGANDDIGVGAEHVRIATPRRLPRDGRQRVSVARLPADSDFFIL